MKKYLLAAIVAVMILAFAGCGDSADTEEATEPETTTAAEETTAPTEPTGPQYTEFSYVKEFKSDLGFDMEVYSVSLTPENDVIMRTQGELAETLGWETQIAEGVKDLYVLPFGNGGFYSILMIRMDDTVTAVNTSKLREDKEVELMDNLGEFKDVSSIEGEQTEDASVIYAFMANGDKEMLDPYLK